MRFFLIWLALLLGVGVELLAATVLHAGPFVVLIGPFLAAAVAIGLMRLPQGPPLAQACAVAGVVWLVVMLGLGTLDPGTRMDHPLTAATPD